ncbi:hypothetical protein EK21DRAFT_60249 [Setomelanomma holmii]|uniref:Uncharacterized protein n=1 Tax=Setomelanomma holmii TaxID=210430 RepID=A0A9P4LP38_9PLEO|nr:hypothetical protein EK21DRAFT_60249 [Setomelanomma holmii]
MSFGISIGDVLKVCELAGRVYKNCRDCPGEFKSLQVEARSLTNLLEDIQDKFSKIPPGKRSQLEDAYEPCISVLQDLDKLLEHYNGLDSKTRRTWDRLKWDPDKTRSLRERLTSSVTMLNSFYTSLIHDNQVLILEALERLELDYKGGHREESIASLEMITSRTVADSDEDSEAAWTQILRDLEDVGVAKEDALNYRDVIRDWLIQAVNEGRLLEESTEQDAFESLSHDFETALPSLRTVDVPGTHYLDVPVIAPSYERSKSAPTWNPSPLLSPTEPGHQRTQSIPSTASMSVPAFSELSSYAASSSSDTSDSLYALPESAKLIGPSSRTSYTQIRRVPVPVRSPAPSRTAQAPTSSAATSTAPSPALASSSFAPPPPPARTPPAIPESYVTPQAVALSPAQEAPSASALSSIPPEPVAAPFPQPFPPYSPPYLAPVSVPASAPALLQTPPSYYDKDSTITADLAWTSQQIIAAWDRRDFASAAKHLEDQLAAVERGHTVIDTGAQPDRRILRHLLGVCNSFTGNFEKAKRYFESVFNGIYLNRNNLDEGDIAAARWLGDICLHLREHSNAVLAWGVAHEGCIGRYGIARDRTRRVGEELRLLDHWLFVFRRIEYSFHNNVDPTDIFRQTHAVEKSNLITALKVHLYENGNGLQSHASSLPAYRPTNKLTARPKMEMKISAGFLLAPLIAVSAWPLPWDSTFSPSDAVQLDRYMNSVRTGIVTPPLVQRELPTVSLGDSKKLHYITKRGSKWLIDTVKQGLNEMGFEHAEHAWDAAVVVCLNQHREGFTFSEGVEIQFRKLSFRSVYGMKVSDVKWSTRLVGPRGTTDTKDFRDIIRGVLERAENEAASMQNYGAGMASPSTHGPFQNYG